MLGYFFAQVPASGVDDEVAVAVFIFVDFDEVIASAKRSQANERFFFSHMLIADEAFKIELGGHVMGVVPYLEACGDFAFDDCVELLIFFLDPGCNNDWRIINITLVIIPIMLALPLIVSVPAYIFDEMENKVIDKNHLEDKRAEVLSAYNMGVNFVEIVFLFASAFVAGLGVSACFTVVGVLMILLAGVHVIKR